MNISFKLLTNSDFNLMLLWLNAPHVKKLWDSEINYTMESIKEKYSSYVKGFKTINGVKKPIYPYIIYYENTPIGYIQYYNALNFANDISELKNVPKSLAGVDIFIGNENYLGKGIGQKVLLLFLDNILFKKFDNAIVDPDMNNISAIQAFNNIGFKKFDNPSNKSIQYMIKTKNKGIL